MPVVQRCFANTELYWFSASRCTLRLVLPEMNRQFSSSGGWIGQLEAEWSFCRLKVLGYGFTSGGGRSGGGAAMVRGQFK